MNDINISVTKEELDRAFSSKSEYYDFMYNLMIKIFPKDDVIKMLGIKSEFIEEDI